MEMGRPLSVRIHALLVAGKEPKAWLVKFASIKVQPGMPHYAPNIQSVVLLC